MIANKPFSIGNINDLRCISNISSRLSYIWKYIELQIMITKFEILYLETNHLESSQLCFQLKRHNYMYIKVVTRQNPFFFNFWVSSILNYLFKVRIEMFPSKRKYKTKVQHVDSPRFNECFKVPRVNSDDVEKMGCRIRLVKLRENRQIYRIRVSRATWQEDKGLCRIP